MNLIPSWILCFTKNHSDNKKWVKKMQINKIIHLWDKTKNIEIHLMAESMCKITKGIHRYKRIYLKVMKNSRKKNLCIVAHTYRNTWWLNKGGFIFKAESNISLKYQKETAFR